ncbi:MAG: GntR family transcriptional regulator [Pseudomonadota bacterium]
MKAIQRPATLKEQALIELRNSIMLGHIKPGQRLVERTIGEQLNVSRTVVRECIRHLESERLVTIIPNSGPVVTELSETEIREIYALRALLESNGVARCAEQISQKESVQLLVLMNQIEDKLSQKKVIKALELTTQLYRNIFLIGGLEISWDLIEQLNSRINQLRIRSLGSTERLRAGPKSLRVMVEAIVRNDPRAASAASERHVERAMQAGLKQSNINTQEE